MLDSFMGVLVFFLSCYGSGYVLRAVFARKGGWFLSSFEIAGGYALTAALLYTSLFFFGRMDWGMLFTLILTLVSLLFLLQRKYFTHTDFPSFGLQHLFCFLACLCVFLSYRNAAGSNGLEYALPNIFDLPKHLSTMIAVNASDGLPILNPYFPEASFVYNTLFYLPISYAASLFSHQNVFLFMLITMWVCWLSFLLLQDFLFQFRVSRYAGIGTALLFFVGSSLPLHAAIKDVFSVSVVRIWGETQMTYFFFVPQHIFSILLFLSGFLYLHQEQLQSPLHRQFIFSLLASIAAVTSYGLMIPLTAMYVALSLFRFVRDVRQPVVRARSVLLHYFCCACVYGFMILFIAGRDIFGTSLSSYNSAASTHLAHLRDLALIPFAFVPLFFLIMMGLLSTRKQKEKSSAIREYGFLCIVVLTCLSVFRISDDLNMKTLMLLRLLLIPFACLGWRFLSSKKRLFPILVASILLLSIPEAIVTQSFLSASIIGRPETTSQTLAFLNDLPSQQKILLIEPNQELAAVLKNPIYMDFSGPRTDRYLSQEDNQKADTLFSTFSSKVTAPTEEKLSMLLTTAAEFNYIVEHTVVGANQIELLSSTVATPVFSNNEYTVLSIEHEMLSKVIPLQSLQTQNYHVISQDALMWTPVLFAADNPDSISFSTENIALSAEAPVDAGIQAEIFLEQGLYLISASFSGSATSENSGSAYVGLINHRKLLSCNGEDIDGEYMTFFQIEEDGLYNLIFGLGGWGYAQGNVTLNALDIYRVPQ